MKWFATCVAVLIMASICSVVSAQISDRVVFARPDPSDPDECEIWIMDAAGGNQQQITNNGFDDVEPRLCGSNKIVFSSNRDGGDYDIWIMNINGSGPINLTPGSAGDDRAPDCDNAGTLTPMVVFRSDSDHSRGEIYKVSAAGGLVTRLTDDLGYDGEPSWCGSDIVFIKHDPLFEPGYTCDPTCPPLMKVRFLPTGQCTAGLDDSRRRKVFLMNAQGGNLRQLTGSDVQESAPSCNATATQVTWSAIDWIDCQMMDHAVIYKCSLASPTEIDCLNTRVTLTVQGNNRHPVFSPGGAAIVFSSNRPSVNPSDGTTDFEIYQMDATGGDQPPPEGFLLQLTGGPDPAQQNDDVDPDWAEAKTP